MMEEQETQEERSQAPENPFESMIEEGYPFFPFVIPLVPLVLLSGAVYILWRYLDRIATGVERQEKLLKQILADVQRRS